MSRRSERRAAVHYESGSSLSRIENVAVEDPLTVTLDGQEVFTTMRTPGDDIDLALGWLVSDGVVHHATDVHSAKECRTIFEAGNLSIGRTPTSDDKELIERTAVEVELRTDERPRPRHGWTSSACGVCGIEAVDDVVARALQITRFSEQVVPAELLLELPERLRAGQQVFERTGGLHAAGLFTLDGELLVLREDVGRHNAVDKVVGYALQQELLPLDKHILQLSGRASFELVQKAAMAGIPVVSAVSAPSSLATELADRVGITLVGFVRQNSMNIYTYADRVTEG
ncbi:MAG TPA: formate dehydrogenase accessory sulfurtransferase FdhD [Actinomycetes bacterium]|nr:formate dehydrogenase accessory sulfurtransferase FdhD [Actinomycetes bacterium]